MIVDRKVGLIGSANLDRRSFELNFENNILLADRGFASAIRERQDQYLEGSATRSPPTTSRGSAFSTGCGRICWQR